MKVVFFGTSGYCLPVLEALHKNFDLALIVTRPDKPTGRKQVLTPSDTKLFGQEFDVPVKDSLASLQNDERYDLGIVADFGQIIPEEIFNKPRLGTFNIHFSKLPELRGASPAQATLLRGDTSAWITIFKLEKDLDTGPILWQKEYSIKPDDTAQSLYVRLFKEVAKELPSINFEGSLTPQDHSKATYTKLLTRHNGFVEWETLQNNMYVASCDRMVLPTYHKWQAMTPWPSLWTIKDGRRMKILKCHTENKKLVLDEIQFEGEQPKPF